MADTYNYIAFGAREYVEQIPDPITMPRGRMFEYTPSELERSLAGLDVDSLAYLDRLPTFLCSEAIRVDGPQASVVIKYGHIRETAAQTKEVSTRFISEIDFGEVTFETIDAAQQFLGLEPWQLYRTHWAVREGDAHDLLRRLADMRPEFGEEVARLTGDAPQVAEPPERARIQIRTATSVESFLGFLSGDDPEAGTETFFRGHENWNFDLTPSLLRKHESGAWQYLPNEDRLCKEILIAHHDEFQDDQYRFDELVRMQHYGIPTRLLDITSNPLVALFFACAETPRDLGVEGEVIVFRVAEDRVKYYDADTVSCIANLSKLTHEQKNDLDLRKDLTDFNVTPEAEKLLHHIRSEKGYFEGRIRPEDLGAILCVKAKRSNDRIKSQSGAFLLYGQDATFPETGQDGIGIERIRVANKVEVLKQLDRININATTVYPSIDRTALHLKARYRVIGAEDIAV
ncbi:MAG: FRG domain-containing protein [Brevundimonas sp.]|uniref:FRG domain-containing protein n=1 Tax=Brevundimonas sp. TaxID=1871086 RepID=UPI001A18BD97|nr:FRG domain-containing protein [Brevundimonas sp.]MBJ7448527.1 FRG domain-containing protein [Brevundimonas sp.]